MQAFPWYGFITAEVFPLGDAEVPHNRIQIEQVFLSGLHQFSGLSIVVCFVFLVHTFSF
jgi:hypothetical protein